MTQPPSNDWDNGQWAPPPTPQHPPQGQEPQGQWDQYPPQGQQPQGQWDQYPPQGQQPQGQWTQQQWTPPNGPAQPWLPQPAPKPRRRAGLIASVAAVAVVAGGGAATYVAFSASSSGGASTPKAAVQKAVGDLQKSDLVGFLDDLAPGERDAMSSPVRDDLNHLKRLHVVKSQTNLSSVSGVSFIAHNLTYAPKTVTINDHVQIVQLTGGTLDMRGDAAKVFTSQFLKTASRASTGPLSGTTHVNIAQAVRSSGKPIRIATVKVGGRWYPSVFYTAADSAANGKVPNASDAVPATGASSGEAAVRATIQAALRGDLRSVIGLVSPTELGAVHDYGGMILDQAGSAYHSTGVTINTLDLSSTAISGGAQRIGLKRLVLSNRNGEKFSLAVRNSCIDVSANGESKHFCAADVVGLFGAFSSFTCSSSSTPSSSGGVSPCSGKAMPAAQKQAFTDLFSSFTNLGVVTTQSGGKWYVAPVRTMAELGSTMLSGLKGNDLLELTHLGS